MKILQIKISESGVSKEYTLTSKNGCCAKDLMPEKELDDLIIGLAKIANDRRDKLKQTQQGE